MSDENLPRVRRHSNTPPILGEKSSNYCENHQFSCIRVSSPITRITKREECCIDARVPDAILHSIDCFQPRNSYPVCSICSQLTTPFSPELLKRQFESSNLVIRFQSLTMAQVRSMVSVGFMLALLSAVVTIQGLDEDFKCPPPINDSSACNTTGPNTNMLRPYSKFIYSSTNTNDNNQTFLGETFEHTIGKNKAKEENQDEILDEKLGKIQSHTENNKFVAIKGNTRISESTETGNRDNLYGNFSDNENKTLSFSYETATKLDERNQTVGYRRNHLFDHYTTMLDHFTTGELNTTSSKENIFYHVNNLNFRMFKDPEIRENSSGHFIDDANTHGPLYYRTTKFYENDYESSRVIKHDNTTINRNQTTMKNIDNINLELGHSYLRYKHDQLDVKKVSKSIQYGRKNINGDFHSKKVLLNFTGDFSTPSLKMKQNSVGHNKEKDFHIPKKFDAVLDFALNSSDHEKDQGWFYNGTTRKGDKVNKGILKSKNIGIKYKSKKAEGMSLYKNADEFFTVSANSNKDQKEQSKSIKVKQTSDSDSKVTGNKQLDAYWTSSGYEKNHQLPYLSGKGPELTKHSLPTYENEEKAFKKRIGEQQNAEHSFSDSRQEHVLKEIPKDTLLQKTNENANEAQKKYTNPKFRTGRKLLQFSEIDNNKVVGSRDDILLSLQRSLKDDPINSWCTLPYGVYNGRLDCTVWSYKKECVLTCTKDDNVRRFKTELKCDRKKNEWEPPFQPCEAIEHLKAIEEKENEESEGNSQALPAYEYITDDEEYDEYIYKFERNHLASNKKSGAKKSQPKKRKG